MKALLLLASVLALATDSFAQAGAPPATIPRPPQRLRELDLGQGGPVAIPEAIEMLARHLRENGEDVPTIILGAGTEGTGVPPLTLRNISGLDAVQMIATAAGCELERIPAVEDPSRAAGWLIRPKAPPAAYGAGYGGEISVGLPGAPAFAGRGGMVPGLTPPAPAPMPGISPTTGALGDASAGAGGLPGASGGGPQGTIVSYGGAPGEHPGAMTMVYPVGGLLTEGKAADAMSALEDALKTAIDSAGLPEKPRLSFHEKTKVLIIKGSPELQRLVGSFLEALEKNRVNASAGELAQAKNELLRTRERAELRESEMAMQLKRLEAQSAELESERRALRRHAEELEAKLPKTGQPAETPRR